MAASLKSRLPAIAAELRPRVSAAVSSGVELVVERAASKAPDRTPYGEGLVAAIHKERTGPAEYAVLAGDEDVFYGHFLEFGTTKTSAQPFLVPALEESKDDIEAIVTAALRGL